jgi:hypothetical protein
VKLIGYLVKPIHFSELWGGNLINLLKVLMIDSVLNTIKDFMPEPGNEFLD